MGERSPADKAQGRLAPFPPSSDLTSGVPVGCWVTPRHPRGTGKAGPQLALQQGLGRGQGRSWAYVEAAPSPSSGGGSLGWPWMGPWLSAPQASGTQCAPFWGPWRLHSAGRGSRRVRPPGRVRGVLGAGGAVGRALPTAPPGGLAHDASSDRCGL